MDVLVVEPYYGGSHRAWADGYRDHSAHDVTVVSHPARFWKWRMHGGFLSLALEVAREVTEHGPPDVILASSMMDVAAFAGAVRNSASGVPIAAYFHESQFTYPLSPADRTDLTYAMKNWSSAATADLVVFNSEYHRSTFRSEVVSLLEALPDARHVDMVSDVMDQSVVVPVGAGTDALTRRPRAPTEPPLVVWNHRWEHDKGPDELRAVVIRLLDRGVDFSVAMCGEIFVSVPPPYAEIVALLGDRLVHRGWAERARYEEILASASVVLSTAHQEFFGIAVVEAVAAGAAPVLPNRLVYPERVRALGADPSLTLYDDIEHAADLIESALTNPGDPAVRVATHQYDWSVVAHRMDEVLDALAAMGPRSAVPGQPLTVDGGP